MMYVILFLEEFEILVPNASRFRMQPRAGIMLKGRKIVSFASLFY